MDINVQNYDVVALPLEVSSIRVIFHVWTFFIHTDNHLIIVLNIGIVSLVSTISPPRSHSSAVIYIYPVVFFPMQLPFFF
jgi:hypothetical protein